MNRVAALSSLSWALALAAPAEAQTVIRGERAGVYTPLASIPGVRALTDIEFDDDDDGSATIDLPFTFNFLVQPFDRAELSTNGALAFGDNVFCCSASNSAPGNTSSPNNVIFAWWDDLVLPAARGYATSGLLGSAPNRSFVIEVRDFEHYSANGVMEGSFQIWLYEGEQGRFEVRYDGTLTAGERYNATAGWEGPTGDRLFGDFRGCRSACDHTHFTTMRGRVFSVEVAAGPDLIGTLDGTPTGARRGELVRSRVSVQNLGSTSTGTVTSRLYLSRDARVDPNDLVVATVRVPTVRAAAPAIFVDVDWTVPAQAELNDYLVLFAVDATNEYVEADESNNLAVSPRYFATTGPPRFFLTERPAPWIDLAALPGLRGRTEIVFTRLVNGMERPDREDADARVPIPFDFNFLGRRAQELMVGTNGLFTFGGERPSRFSFNEAPGTRSAPNDFIAAWWDDLAIPDARGYADYGVVGAAPNRALVIEVRDFERSSYNGARDGSFQLWLYEGPSARFELRYRGVLSPSERYSATAGVEGPAGDDLFGSLRPCGNQCAEADYATMIDRAFAVVKATGPELVGGFGEVPGGALPGQPIVVEVEHRNLGADSVPTVSSRLWFSVDRTLDAQDTLAATVSAGPIAPEGAETTLVPISVPAALPLGAYYLILEVDAGNAVAEIEERNNLAVTDLPIRTAYDLRAPSVSLSSAIPMARTPVAVVVENGVVRYSGPLILRVYASRERIFDRNDPLLGTLAVNLAGRSSERFDLELTVPAIPPGVYFPIVVVDPDQRVPEIDEFDNVTVGDGSFSVGPELAVESLVVPATAVPGQAIEVTTRLSSIVGAFTGAVEYRMWLSADRQRDPSDLVLGDYSVRFAGEPAIEDRRTPSFPTGLAPVGHYVLVGVDPNGRIAEADETNNELSSAAPIASGPDFTVGAMRVTPLTARAGDRIDVELSVLAGPIAFRGPVRWALWFASDEAIDAGTRMRRADDVRLGEGTIDFAGQPALDLTLTATIGPRVPIREGWVFIEIDSDQAIAEARDDDNWGRSPARLRLIGPNLRVLRIAGAARAVEGAPYIVELTITNDGVEDARELRYSYHFAAEEALRPGVAEVFRSPTLNLAAGETRRFSDTVRLMGGAPRRARLGVLLDPDATINEADETDNQALVPSPVDLLVRGPDLIASITEVGANPRGGFPLAVARRLANVGLEDASGFAYEYYLSLNPTLAEDDVRVGRFTASLASGADETALDELRLPAETPSGTYYLGLVLDPADLIRETEEGNNSALAPAPIRVSGANLTIAAASLPAGEVGQPYRAGLASSAPAFSPTWSLSRGRLPAGLRLDARTGTISGTPESAGASSFTVSARVGDHAAERSFTIEVVASTRPLSFDTAELPLAIVGVAYCADQRVLLRASGGTPPYAFAAEDPLPAGLALSDEGALCGTPATTGVFTIGFTVRDALGASAARSLRLDVRAGAQLRVSTVSLPLAEVQVAYEVMLSAEGGNAPHRFSIDGALPAGLSLAPEGRISGTPTASGSAALVVKVRDAGGAEAQKRLLLVVAARSAVAADDCGCRAGGRGAPWGVVILLLGGALRARGRRVVA